MMPKEFDNLTEDSVVIGGQFMQALAEDDIEWEVVSINGDVIEFHATWLGVSLGTFEYDGKTTTRKGA